MKIEKEAKTLAEAVEKDVQAVVNPATAGAMETTEQNKKLADETNKEVEKTSEEALKGEQNDAHQDIPSEVKANFKKLHLAESLDDEEGWSDDYYEDGEEEARNWFDAPRKYTSDELDKIGKAIAKSRGYEYVGVEDVGIDYGFIFDNGNDVDNLTEITFNPRDLEQYLNMNESLNEDVERVAEKDFDKAYSQLRRDCYQKFGSRIEIFEMPRYGKEPIEMGVNWASIGTVSADETSQFGNNLIDAAKMAREFPYNGKKVEYDDNESLNENTIESGDRYFRTNDRTSEILDAAFGYMREAFGDDKFTEIAIDHLGMDQKELMFYCDIDGEGYFEALNEADEEEYPHTFLGSNTHFRRKNLTDLNEIEITYPSFTVKYNVEPGVQTKPGDPAELGFERDELARLEIARDEQDRVENLFKDAVTKTLSDKGYKNIYIGGGALVGIPNAIHLMGDKVGESLTEAVEESTFSKLYGDLVQIPYVDRFVRTKFSKDEKQVDLTIILDDYIDMDAVYDVLDQYADKIVVDEDDEELHIHIDMSNEERNTDIPNDLFDEIMTQLTAGGRLIPGKGKGYVSDYGAGYDEVSQIANADGDKGIVIRILPGHEADRKGHVSTFEPAKAIADKYKDLGVYTTERTEIEKTSPHRVTKVMTIWIPEGAKAAGRDERLVKKKKEEPVKDTTEEKPVEEAVVKTKLGSFEPWEGAVDTFNKIKEAGKLGELENLIDELYDGEVDTTKLNDLLWFEDDWVLETLGIKNDD